MLVILHIIYTSRWIRKLFSAWPGLNPGPAPVSPAPYSPSFDNGPGAAAISFIWAAPDS